MSKYVDRAVILKLRLAFPTRLNAPTGRSHVVVRPEETFCGRFPHCRHPPSSRLPSSPSGLPSSPCG
ncbi:hypothetical protein LCGC14_1542210, partial [marine sediment metagenome]